MMMLLAMALTSRVRGHKFVSKLQNIKRVYSGMKFSLQQRRRAQQRR